MSSLATTILLILLQVHTMANAQIPEIAAMGDFDNVVTTLEFPSGMLTIN